MTTLHQDLKELRTNPSLEVKGRIVNKITKLYNSDEFSPSEKLEAEAVIKLMVAKSIAIIKEIIAKNLKYNTEIGRDVILQLAQDVEQVSLPILECSPLLTNQDLIAIVHDTNNENCLSAIARRQDIREDLSKAIVMRNFTEPTITLFSNLSALIPESSYFFVLDHHHSNPHMIRTIASRHNLPIAVVNKIISYASEEIKQQLLAKYPSVSHTQAEDLHYHKLRASAEHQVNLATYQFISDITQDDQGKVVIESVEDLFQNGELEPNLIITSLCKGNLLFFASALAKRAQQSYQTAYNIIFTEGISSFASLYKAADMPKAAYESVSALLQIILEMYPEGKIDQNEFSTVITSQIIQRKYHERIKMMPELMAIISFPSKD